MAKTTDSDQVRRVAASMARPAAPPVAELMEEGRQLRTQAPRSSHAYWTPSADRPDPLELLAEQDKTREQDLVPIRYGRMMVSPFAFYRGSAVVMARDLAPTRPPVCECRRVATRIWRTSAPSPRRSATRSSISTTSTRRCQPRG